MIRPATPQFPSFSGSQTTGLDRGRGSFFTKGVLHCGQFPREPRWLCGLIAFVGGWDEPHRLQLHSPSDSALDVLVRCRGGKVCCVQSDACPDGGGSMRLAALDACVQFALHRTVADAVGEHRFLYAVTADPGEMEPESNLGWAVEHFGMSVGCLFDLLADEEPFVQASGFLHRHFRLTQLSEALVASLETEGERLLVEALRPLLAGDGVNVDTREVAALAGISVITAAAIMGRLWRAGIL